MTTYLYNFCVRARKICLSFTFKPVYEEQAQVLQFSYFLIIYTMIENSQDSKKQQPFTIVYHYRTSFKTPVKAPKKVPEKKPKKAITRSYLKQKNQQAQVDRAQKQRKMTQNIASNRQHQFEEQASLQQLVLSEPNMIRQFQYQNHNQNSNYNKNESQYQFIDKSNGQRQNQSLYHSYGNRDREGDSPKHSANGQLLWGTYDLENVIPVQLEHQELNQELLLEMTSVKNANIESSEIFNKKF